MKFLNTVVKNMRDLYDTSKFYQDDINKEAKQHLLNDLHRYRGQPNSSISAKANQIWDSVVGLAIDLTIPQNSRTENVINTDVKTLYLQEKDFFTKKSNKLHAFASAYQRPSEKKKSKKRL